MSLLISKSKNAIKHPQFLKLNNFPNVAKLENPQLPLPLTCISNACRIARDRDCWWRGLELYRSTADSPGVEVDAILWPRPRPGRRAGGSERGAPLRKRGALYNTLHSWDARSNSGRAMCFDRNGVWKIQNVQMKLVPGSLQGLSLKLMKTMMANQAMDTLGLLELNPHYILSRPTTRTSNRGFDLKKLQISLKILDQNRNTTFGLILLLPEILTANADNGSENRKLLVGRKERESYQKGKCCSVFCLHLMWILGWAVSRDDLDTHLFSKHVGNAGGKLKQHPAWQPLSFHGRFGLRNNEV